jgi:long-chain acyl-CoA synthetase
MSWCLEPSMTMRAEAHFGERVVRCFYPRPANIDSMLGAALECAPDAEAIVSSDGERVDYARLEQRVARTADHLARLGLGKGDRIALLLGNVPEFVYLLLAAARLGAISVPLNIREQTPEIEYALNHSGAKMLAHGADLADRLPRRGATPALTHLFTVGGDSAGSHPFAHLLESGCAPHAAVEVAEEDVAVILYTSGTTGKPKGAMLTHFSIVHSVLHYRVCMGLGMRERSLLAVPASHVTGVVAIISTMIGCAGAVVMMREFKARACLEVLARERISHTILVPAMYNLCLLDRQFDSYDLSAMRVGGYGGAPMPQATIATLAQKLPNLVLTNAYGSTETTSPVTLMPPGEGAKRADTVGKVLPCAEVKVMSEAGHEVASGEQGELWIAGPMVVKGYWDNPAATAAGFIGGYWRSGDIGSIDSYGYVRVFDRMKDMINRAGYKVYSAEVENVLAHHHQVIECAVVPVPDPVLGEKTHAFVRHRDASCAVNDLRAFCAQRLSDYKVPDFFTLQDEPLPRNANGKILKRELRERAAAIHRSG